jgi:hypothetical protein
MVSFNFFDISRAWVFEKNKIKRIAWVWLFKNWKLMRLWPGGKDFRLFKAVILDGYWTNTL